MSSTTTSTTISSVTVAVEDDGMSREDVLLAAAIIFFVAFFGLIFNMLGITVVLKNPVLKNSFGSLCLSHSIANSGVLFVFFIWSAPATYIQAANTSGMVNKLLGQLNILCWDACVYSHLVISFNRFFSIAIPAKASFIFSRRNTLIIIGIAWAIAFCHIFPYFWYDSCYITYNPISWTWDFADTECGSIISTYTDYYTSVAIFIAMSSVDFATLILLILHRKHSHFASNEESVKRRKVEIRFFIQSCLQGALFFYEIFNFYYISTLNSNQWFVFMTSTFAWEICHCLDGFVVVLFHFRRRIFTGDGTLSARRMSITFSTEQYAETLLVAMLNFFVGFFGLILNGLSLLTILKSPHLQNTYGTLSLNHSCLNIATLLIYFLWVTPTTYVQSTDADSPFGKVIGQLYLLFWISMVYSHLYLSLNRLVAIVFPRHSNSLFSHNFCVAFIIFTWLVGLFHIVPFFWYEQCFLTYDPLIWVWNMSTTKCGQTFRLLVMQYCCIMVLTFILVINIGVFLYIKLKAPLSLRHSEIRLFAESMTRSTVFLLVTIFSSVLGSLIIQRWERYLCTTFVWQLYHLFDGFLVLLLHFKRKLLAEHREVSHRPVSFVHFDNHHPHGSHGHLPHSHDSLRPHPHHDIHILHHHQFSKVDTA